MNLRAVLPLRPRGVIAAMLCVAMTGLACAQASSNAATDGFATHDAQNASAAVPAVVYRSAFENYRAFSKEKVRPWRETNDAVERIGGWRTYLRESQQGVMPSVPAPVPTPRSTPPSTPSVSIPPSNPAPHVHQGGHDATQ